MAATAADEAPAVAHFDILEFRVLGNTVLARERIERVLVPFMGEKKTVADVEAARTALEAAFRDAGFGTVLVDTPEQRIVGGLVTLQVVEAPVSRLRVVGSRYHSQERILEQVPGLSEGRVPNFTAVSGQLGEVNRSPDRKVTPMLRPGKLPGTTEVDLQVEDELPFHASLELNNKHSASTSRTRLVASVRYDNLWQREHSLNLQFQTSPQNVSEVRVFSLSYTVPEDDGLLLFSAARSQSTTVTSVNDSNVFGRGSIYGVRRIFIDRDETRSRMVTLGADYKDLDEAVRFSDELLGFTTPIRYVPLQASLSLTHPDPKGAWQGGLGLVFALRGLASEQSQFADKRYLAQSNFSLLKFDLGRTQALPGDVVFAAKMEGQVSSQPLISNEQFVVGGVDSVRGYPESTAVGDKGLRMSFELRTPRLGAADPKGWLQDLRAHAFLDGAGVWLVSPLPEQDSREGLVGAGVGLRLKAGRRANLSLDVGHTLHKTSTVGKGTTRLHATAQLEF